MEYISHSDYTDMLKNFGKETPKGMLKEGMEKEGNAFTAGLAKAKKGETFKVDGKTVKDKSNYDAPGVKEATINDEYPESWKMREDDGMEEGALSKMVGGIKKAGQLAVGGVHSLASAFQVTPAEAAECKRKVRAGEYESYTDCERAVVTAKGKTYVAPQSHVQGAAFGATKEGLNLPSPEMKATGQTIQTVEGDQLNRFSVLSPSEREQLKEYIQSIKTIKEEIKKLVSKTKTSGMEESQMGGNRTGLVMTKGGMQEDGGEEAEQTISPKLHTILEKLIAALRAEGLDDQDIQMLVKHEMEEAGKQAVAAQWDM